MTLFALTSKNLNRKRAEMVSVREVICGTELDKPAESALRYSFFVTERFHSSLHVLHAHDGGGECGANRYVSSAERMQRLLANHRLRERLDAVVRSVTTSATAHAMSHVADGTWTEAVFAFSERQHADVVVLGSSENQAGASRIDQLAQRTRCPLLSVPAHQHAGPPRLKRILLALEPEEDGGALLEWATLWARQFGASVRLLFCEGPSSESARWQREFEGKLRSAGLTLSHCRASLRSEIAERVQSEAALGESDLIMMSANLRDDRDRSVAALVRRTGAAPLLSVRHARPDRLFIDPALEGDGTASVPPPLQAMAAPQALLISERRAS